MKVISILPSYYFPSAVVVRTACGHDHIRPSAIVQVKVGDDFRCYCETQEAVTNG